MRDIVIQAQAVAMISAPLIVALVCLYAYHRRIGRHDLLLWSAAHLALTLTFVMVQMAPVRGELHDLPLAWRLAQMFNVTTSWLLLLGVLAMENARITALRGVLAALAISLTVTLLAGYIPGLYLYAGLFINPLINLSAGLILIWRRRTAVYVLAGVALSLRSLNGFLYVQAVQQAGAFVMPSHTVALAIFFNFLTGISLLALAVENAWRRLGAALDEARVSEAVMDLAPVSILHKDRNLKILRANRFFANHVERFQHGRDTVLGDRSGALMPADGAEAMEKIDRQLLAEPDMGPLEREVTLTPADAPPVTLLVRKAAVRDRDGNATGIVSASLDITRLKVIEAELREQISVAEQASKAKSDFLANMSHELRTPLNAISGFAEMLGAGYPGPLTAQQQEYIGNILASSRNMLDLVSRILDLSRLDASTLALQRRSVDLGAIMAGVLADAAPMAAEAGVTLRSHLLPAVASVDAAAVRQVMANLLSNAIRFNRRDGEVSVEMRQRDGRTVIAIADTGIGMTAAQIAAAGDPFLRTDPFKARSGGGAGLGLAISRGLVELHGGDLMIASTADSGTTVTISL